MIPLHSTYPSSRICHQEILEPNLGDVGNTLFLAIDWIGNNIVSTFKPYA